MYVYVQKNNVENDSENNVYIKYIGNVYVLILT